MKLDFDSKKPLFLQIAEEIEDAVFTGAFPAETQIPSTTEIAAAFRINPATVLKGMNLLVEEDVIYKKRGLGMFVTAGALDRIKKKRRQDFFDTHVIGLISEAKKLGLSPEEIIPLIERGMKL